MTLRKVRGGDVLAALSGVAIVALLFAPWAEVLVGAYFNNAVGAASRGAFVTLDVSGWDRLTATLVPLLLLALFGLALLAANAFERTPAVPVAVSVFGGAVALITFVWMVVRVLTLDDARWGAYATLAAVALTFAGFVWSLRDEIRP